MAKKLPEDMDAFVLTGVVAKRPRNLTKVAGGMVWSICPLMNQYKVHGLPKLQYFRIHFFGALAENYIANFKQHDRVKIKGYMTTETAPDKKTDWFPRLNATSIEKI